MSSFVCRSGTCRGWDSIKSDSWIRSDSLEVACDQVGITVFFCPCTEKHSEHRMTFDTRCLYTRCTDRDLSKEKTSSLFGSDMTIASCRTNVSVRLVALTTFFADSGSFS